eukprot:TRINITY_DN9246_c0_g2_i1.p1 TRINITY_DN9246_c0_g2~~TRINITY_DN9246_c0_g2_i1.p1  ORF type:complete len:220 (+),score=24.17 TRINITY_DN9246_c0_g2_i1:101-760(+)
MAKDKAARAQELEAERQKFGVMVQLFERDFGTNSYLHRAPEFRNPQQLAGAKILVNRYKLLGLLPKRGRVVEVGVDRGNFSRQIIQATEPTSLTLIDIDLSRMTEENTKYLSQHPAVTIIGGDSATTLQSLNGEFDWIYIDAHHGYEYVTRDIQASCDKIKVGGYLVFNDYTLWSPANMMNYGVLRAVNEFMNDHQGWTVTHLALQGAGYYDLAAQRIA